MREELFPDPPLLAGTHVLSSYQKADGYPLPYLPGICLY